MENKNASEFDAPALHIIFDGAEENARLRRTVEELEERLAVNYINIEIERGRMYLDGKLI